MILCDINFAAITAMATTIAAVMAFFSLKNEREKRKLSVFSESIRTTLDGTKNTESLEYILSNKFNKDIKAVKYYLDMDSNDKVGLDDFEKIVIHNLTKEGLTIEDNRKEELRKSYKKIKYFCERMDYLGVVAEDKTARRLIVKYFKQNIINTYQKLESLILKTREEQKDKDLYMNYTKLYELAQKSHK